MGSLPIGAKSDIEITVTISGGYKDVLDDIRRMRAPGVKREANVRSYVRVPGKRWLIDYHFGRIAEGNCDQAMADLEKVASQRRLTDDQQHRLDAVIRELADRTR